MNELNRSKGNKWVFIRWVGTLLTLALLFYLLSQQGWQEIGSAVNGIGVWRFSIALLLTFVSRFAIITRWYILLRSAGAEISYPQTTRLTFAGLFASNFLPTTIGGDVVRLAGALQAKVDSAVATASLVVDRLIGMTGMALALPLSLPGITQLQQVLFPNTSFHPQVVFAILPGVSWLSPWLVKVQKFLVDTWHTFSMWYSQPGFLFSALAFSGLHMVCLFGSIALLLDGLEDPMSFWLIGGLWSLVYFITLIPISINGYGLQEISMALIFSRAGGVAEQNSLTVALMVRTLTMLTSLPGAFFVSGLLSDNRAVKESKDPNE